MGLNEMLEYGNIGVIIISILMIAGSGIFFSFTYFIMDTTQTAFETNDCVIEGNNIVSSCQELWDLALYPFLNMKEILIWLSYFFIFTLILALLLLGYTSGFRPITMGLLVLTEILIVYGSLYVANIYRILISNVALREIMLPFTVYNKIMMNFPWFIFIISVFSIALGLVNWQRTRTNSSSSDLNY